MHLETLDAQDNLAVHIEVKKIIAVLFSWHWRISRGPPSTSTNTRAWDHLIIITITFIEHFTNLSKY